MLLAKNAEGGTVRSVAYTEGPASVTAFVTAALGIQPSSVPAATGDGAQCLGGDPAFAWWGTAPYDGVMVTSSNRPAVSGSALVIVDAATVDGIAIAATDGTAVGDKDSALIAGLDDAQKATLTSEVPEGGTDTHAFVFITAGTFAASAGPRLYGVAAISDSGAIERLTAPAGATGSACAA